MLKNHSTSGAQITITNAATSNNDSTIRNNTIVTPSAPKMQEEVPIQVALVQDAPPPYHSTVDINKILDIPIPERTAAETRRALRHLEENSIQQA